MCWYNNLQVFAAGLSFVAAAASAIAAWTNFRVSSYNQAIQTHRANLKNLAEICNEQIPNSDQTIEFDAIVHIYRCLYRAMEGLDKMKKDRESMTEHFYLNLKPLIRDEIQSGKIISNEILSKKFSNEETKKWKAVQKKLKEYFPDQTFP